MRYLSVFINPRNPVLECKSRRGHRDAKLARSVQKKASRATISIHIAARSLRRTLCTRPAPLRIALGARESETQIARGRAKSAGVQLGGNQSGQQSARDASRRGI